MSEQSHALKQHSLLAVAEFIPLILSAMHQANMSAAQLARKSGVNKTKISRGLNRRSPIDLVTLQRLFLALDIDAHRALLAIGHLGDWHRYYDPDIEVLSGLVDHLPESLAAARDGGERVAIGPMGIKQLACRISAVIADNDREVCQRRDAFMFEADLRRVH